MNFVFPGMFRETDKIRSNSAKVNILLRTAGKVKVSCYLGLGLKVVFLPGILGITRNLPGQGGRVTAVFIAVVDVGTIAPPSCWNYEG